MKEKASYLQGVCSLKRRIPETSLGVFIEKPSMGPLTTFGRIKYQPTFITSPMSKHCKCNTLATATRTIQDNLLFNFRSCKEQYIRLIMIIIWINDKNFCHCSIYLLMFGWRGSLWFLRVVTVTSKLGISLLSHLFLYIRKTTIRSKRIYNIKYKTNNSIDYKARLELRSWSVWKMIMNRLRQKLCWLQKQHWEQVVKVTSIHVK